MSTRKTFSLLAIGLTMVILVSGCADGILFEKPRPDGGVQRLRIDGGEMWGDMEITPRYRSQKSKDNDDYCIILKNEATF